MSELLSRIQKNLSVPKNRTNKFGNYKYRSCEDIVDAIKPLLEDSASLVVSDKVVLVGDRHYIKATASLIEKDGVVTLAHGWAREAKEQKGMAEAQLTGSTSSYARKYALCGLFAIDDGVDDDSEKGRLEPIETPEDLSKKLIAKIDRMETIGALAAWVAMPAVISARERLFTQDAKLALKVDDMVNLKTMALK